MDGRRSPLNAMVLLSRAARSAAAMFAVLAGTPYSHCAVACKPIIAVTAVQVFDGEEMQRTWTATLSIDAAYCATSSGPFEIDFVRAKEYAPDMQFTEQFRWKGGEVKVSLDLRWDEVITDFRIGFIAPCVCRELSF